MPKEKNSLSKEEIFYSAPDLEVGREYRKEEGVIKETPRSPTSKTSEQCKRIDEEDTKYIVPKMDLTYSLRDEEDKEEVISVMPSSGSIRKSNRIKILHLLNWMIFMVNLNQNDNNNSIENCFQFTANSNHNQKNFYKNNARNNNLSLTDSDSNQVLRIYLQNICGLGSKMNDLLVSLYPNLPHILCLTEHHLRQFQIQHITMDDYNLGAEFSRQSFHKGGGCMFIQKIFHIQ